MIEFTIGFYYINVNVINAAYSYTAGLLVNFLYLGGMERDIK